MLDNILNLEGVTAIDKTAQNTIQGGDLAAYFLCLRLGGSNCGAHVH